MYFDPYILAKMRKMLYFDPYFSSKLGKMYSFDPLFWPLKRFESTGGEEHPYPKPDRVPPCPLPHFYVEHLAKFHKIYGKSPQENCPISSRRNKLLTWFVPPHTPGGAPLQWSWLVGSAVLTPLFQGTGKKYRILTPLFREHRILTKGFTRKK